jgi:VanZ family protein
MAVIFYLSSLQDPLPALTARVWDKSLHLVEYGGLGALLLLALRASAVAPRRAVLGAVAAASLYGATDELHQAFVPGRTCDARDWAADSVGGAAGAGALVVALRQRGARASIRPARRRG